MKRISRKTSIIGLRYGRLIVQSYYGLIGKDRAWNCICDCGKNKICKTNILTKGAVKSCGCLQKEVMSHKNGNQYKLNKGISVRNAILNGYKNSAKKRKIEWKLTDDFCFSLFKKSCEICGIEPNNDYSRKNSNGSYSYNGIDRITNEIGYEVSNVQTLCKRCNIAKNDMTKIELENWLKRIVENYNGRIKK